METSTLLSVDRATFKRLLGGAEELLLKRATEYEKKK